MQKIGALLKAQNQLSSLTEQASSLIASQALWLSIVPENLKPYTQAGNIKHKRLTVHADNGAIAARIKMLSPSLLIQLQKQGVEVTSIRVQVQVQSNAVKPDKLPRTLSPRSASDVHALAEKLSGTELGDALARLATRVSATRL